MPHLTALSIADAQATAASADSGASPEANELRTFLSKDFSSVFADRLRAVRRAMRRASFCDDLRLAMKQYPAARAPNWRYCVNGISQNFEKTSTYPKKALE
jgi:hypothetical protein